MEWSRACHFTLSQRFLSFTEKDVDQISPVPSDAKFSLIWVFCLSAVAGVGVGTSF